MNELDRIQHALATNRLDKDEFERCATDLLGEIYPGLSPIPGGTDWGRDADVNVASSNPPLRLLVTTSRTLEGVRKNLNSGLNSMKKHGVPVERVVLANPMPLSGLDRDSLQKSAGRKAVKIEAFYDQHFFASKLRRDTRWREALLHLSGDALALTRIPADIAEAPWASLPLVGREADVATLKAQTGDVIVLGNPGVGKTRVVAAIDDVVFVDGDSAPNRLLDDLRLTTPSLVALDDAGQHLELLRRLVQLRRVEGDLLNYRLIAICWPDELGQVRDVLMTANDVTIGLLERSAVDAIITSLGVTGQLARTEILNQAEGRPGWAIALADMLTKTRNWASLFDGRVLLGQVERFLRRSQVAPAAIDVLAVVSALREVRDADIGKMAAHLHMSLPETRALLLNAAHSGLVDTSAAFDRNGMPERIYQVRPPMLAIALVAEHAFRAEVVAVRVTDLLTDWKDRAEDLAESTTYSAVLGAEEAVPVAKALVRPLQKPGVRPIDFWQRLGEPYACINQSCGEEVLGWIERESATLRSEQNFDARAHEPLTKLAALLARRYLLGGAVRMLLDAAPLDRRPQNQAPEHPLRVLGDLVEEFHPELAPTLDVRHLVAKELDEWIGLTPDDGRGWDAYSQAFPIVMSLRLRTSFLNPGDPRQLHLAERTIGPNDVQEVYEKIWPGIRTRLATAPPSAVRAAIDLAADWLRVGAGYDHPFGGDHDARSTKAAARFGKKLLNDLKPLVSGNLGLGMRLKHMAEEFDIDLRLRIDDEYAPFLENVERGSDWLANADELQGRLRELAQPWAADGPADAIPRLVEVRDMIALAGIAWPSRVELACQAIGEVADDLPAWIEAALDADLFPDAAPFVALAVAGGQSMPDQLVEHCLADPKARWSTLGAILSAGASQNQFYLAVQNLKLSDERLLESLAFQNRLSVETWQVLLANTADAVRGVAAFAMFRAARDRAAWPPADLAEDWFEAIKLFDPNIGLTTSGSYDRSLFEFLATARPALLQEYAEAHLATAVSAGTLDSVTGLREYLHLLPASGKTSVMQRFGGTHLRWLLLRYLPGDDIGWLTEALDSNLITPPEALNTRTGFGKPEPTIPQLAALLVPRGIEPTTIAAHAEFGMGTGEESERLESLIVECSGYEQSEDASVASVGRAGVQMYRQRQEQARARERVGRIRGEL